MPETMSVERRVMLLALGAEVVLTPKETAVSGALAKATEILEGLGEQGHMLQQFENPSNAAVHRDTTGPEIWRDTEGTVDVFVAGVGTGGTVTGTTQYLKGCGKGNCEGCDQTSCGGVNKQIYTVAVEPQEQMLLTAAKGGEKIGEQVRRRSEKGALRTNERTNAHTNERPTNERARRTRTKMRCSERPAQNALLGTRCSERPAQNGQNALPRTTPPPL